MNRKIETGAMKNGSRRENRLTGWAQMNILVSVLLLAATAGAQPGTISTYAGGGSFDRPALDAALATPHGVAVDAFGNLFVASEYDQRVFRVDAVTGQMSVVAGAGRRDFGPDGEGDGGPATQALLNHPVGLAFDSQGHLYICDSLNPRVRRVDAGSDGEVTGAADEIITTYAGNGSFGFDGDGGPATAARFNTPTRLAFDADDNLYVADRRNGRVRRIDRSTGIISTAAGTGVSGGFNGDGIPATSANLGQQLGVAIDTAGNVFLNDNSTRVRRVDVVTGIITTVAGTGGGGFVCCNRPATTANFVGPRGLAFDAAGNLLIASFSNRVVMRVSTGADALITGELDEIITCLTCGKNPGVRQPVDVAVDAATQDLFIATAFHDVRKLDAVTDTISIVAGGGSGGDGGLGTAATLANPQALALNAAGDLYVSESASGRVRKVELNSGLITSVTGGGALAVVDGIPATDAEITSTTGVAVDHQGILYLSEHGRSRILRVDPSGSLTIFAGIGVQGFGGDGGPATSAILNFPQGLAVDAVGDLYIADWINGRVRRVTVATGVIETVAGNGGADGVGLGGPATEAGIGAVQALAFDADGNLFLTSFQLLRVLRVDAATQVITVVAGTGSSFFFGDGGPATSAGVAPLGVAFDAAGNLYISDHGNQASATQSQNLIRKVVPGADGLITGAADEIITTIAGDGTYGLSGDGGPATLASMAGPWEIAVDGNQAVYIADYYNQRVRRVELNTPPIADAGADQELILGETAHFDGGGSVDLDGTIVLHSWDFDDGSSDVGEIVAHEYTTTGTFTVTLTVEDDAGATAADTTVATILAASEAVGKAGDEVAALINDNAGTPLADALAPIADSLQAAEEALASPSPDPKVGLENLKSAAAGLEAAVKDGLLDSGTADQLMELLARISRVEAVGAIEAAEAQGGNQKQIQKARDSLADGDALVASGEFKQAISAYKKALAKAQSAIA